MPHTCPHPADTSGGCFAPRKTIDRKKADPQGNGHRLKKTLRSAGPQHATNDQAVAINGPNGIVMLCTVVHHHREDSETKRHEEYPCISEVAEVVPQPGSRIHSTKI